MCRSASVMTPGKYIRTEAHRQRTREIHLGVKRGPRPVEVRQKIAQALKGKPFSAEHRKNIQAAMDDEHRRKISVALTGLKRGPMSAEERLKRSVAQKGRKFSAEHCEKLRQAMLGKKRAPFSAVWRARIGAAQKGKKHKIKNRKAWRQNISASRRRNGSAKGSRNPNWKGGTTKLSAKLRNSDEYKAWRKAVYQRDGYRCVRCRVKGNGRNLNAHHKVPFCVLVHRRDFKMMWDPKNGITLCEDCHELTDSYGWRAWNNFLRKVM